MSQDLVMQIFLGAVGLAFKLCAPMLITAMIVGLIIAILQAATQVHEQTLTFAPKAIAVALGLLALGPWMINEIIDYMNSIFELMSGTNL
ncbi:MAG: flagellar biosynthesis protein FliQ [Oscillospiraceae bacterium]|jgi:flagellar biosynthetic protein FliQ|nr:flagellar biosynthesis protein FliQ [Oscillospiraceae bacterium]